VNHTSFPKEDHLADWARGDKQSYKGWLCRMEMAWDDQKCTQMPSATLEEEIVLNQNNIRTDPKQGLEA